MITLDIENLTAGAPLYAYLTGQMSPQPAYVEINEDGFVSADYSGEVGGGVPESVWHNRTIRIRVPAEASGEALADLLRGDALPLLEAIHAGHSIEWDGSNHVGRLDDEARSAAEELERLLEDVQQMDVWDAGQWLESAGKLTQVWRHGQTLADAETENEFHVESNQVVTGDMRLALARWAGREIKDAIYDEDGSVICEEWIDGALAEGEINAEDAETARALIEGVTK